MRLLERKSKDEFGLTEDFVGNIPVYTILSHTWGTDNSEVTFKDINEGSEKSKAGYRKIRFCGEQAARDGYRYFWVDTCCIDKSNAVELSEALNSMYRWYLHAAKCYVYLTDVSIHDPNSINGLSISRDEAFRKSKWFTRGWTLQELIAPQSIQFFSLEGELLGDKKLLEQQIHEITGIAVSALRGTPLSEFSVKERLLWAENRETTREEDKAYSLLGIFSVFLPLIYGEGRDHAIRRLQEAIDRSIPSIQEYQNLPFPRNTNFVGRESYLEQLAKNLNPRRFTTTCPWMALDGLGGVGKTQIALQFAYQFQENLPQCSVFWVQASNAESFNSSYYEIAQKLDIPGLGDEKVDVKQHVVTSLTSLLNPWLLIVDNADDVDVLRNPNKVSESHALIEYIPKHGNGAVLFTTRDHKAATGLAKTNVLRVNEMSRQESIELFKNSFQVHNRSLLDDGASIEELLDLLLDLPLAIKQAAAFINNNSTPISKYLSFYRKSEQEIIEVLSEDFEEHGRYRGQKNPVATTWLISFEQLKLQDPLAAEYLSFIGVLGQDNIPISLLPPAKSAVNQEKGIGTLTAYSFVTRQTGEDAFDVHRLVQLATLNWLRMEDVLSIWADKALNRLVEVIPAGDYTDREVWTRYLPHGIRLADTIEVRSDNGPVVIELLDRIGRCQYLLGQYIGAEKMNRETLALRQKVLGKKHPDTLTSMNEIAGALSGQGKYAEAEVMNRETLALRQKVSGKKHPHTLTSMSGIARALSDQGKYTEAEAMHRETLALRQKVSGKEHPDTLASMNGIAGALSGQGKYAEAESMHRETLALRQKVSGKEHPHTLTSMNGIARALSGQGKYTEAEVIHRETLALDQKVSGKEHPDTLTSMNGIAVVLSDQGKYAEAEAMHRETLALRQKVLGQEHPHTLTSMNEIARALSNQGKYAEAEAMHRETLALRQKVSGMEHPHTLTSMSNIGMVLSYQDKYTETEAIHRETLALRQKVLGKKHPDTLKSMNGLAGALRGQGKYAEAEAMHRETLALR